MKKGIFLGLVMINLLNCQQNKEKVNSQLSNKETKMQEKQIIYSIKISAANPYEIYINDMPLEKDYEKGSSNTEIPINDFLLKSGEQIIKLILLPNHGKNLVDKAGIDYTSIKVYKYNKGITNMDPNDAEIIKEYSLKDMSESSIVTKQFILNLEIPYKLRGWSNSVDLSKENKDQLKKEALEKYTEIRNLINSGDYNSFSKSYQIKNNEVYQSYYNNSEAMKEDEEWMKKRIYSSKNNMIPLTNVSLHINGNGKIVYLENDKHESPLISNDGKYEEVYNILLHRPKPGAPLEIIR